jgi:F0F1-type ATP synthase gamma subunit
MKNLIAIALFAATAVLAGCRRTDVRDFEISVPAMTQSSETVIRQALAKYAGVEQNSYRFDHAAKKVFLRYDSMQIAKKNIEMAIAAAGLEANGVTPASIGK